MNVTKRYKGSISDMLNAMKDALVDSSRINSSTQTVSASTVYEDVDGIFTFPGGHVDEEELREYWTNNRHDDPVLDHYDSFEDWMKDTRVNLLEVSDYDDFDDDTDDSLDMDTVVYGNLTLDKYLEEAISKFRAKVSREVDSFTDPRVRDDSIVFSVTYSNTIMEYIVPIHDFKIEEGQWISPEEAGSYMFDSVMLDIDNGKFD